MTNGEINESPRNPTSGLSSAIQLVDFTSAELFAIGNTSSSLPVIGQLVHPSEQGADLLPSRRIDFATALRESLQNNKPAIRELAKY